MRVWVDDVRPMPPDFNVHITSLEALCTFLVNIESACVYLGDKFDATNPKYNPITFISFDHDMPPMKAVVDSVDRLLKTLYTLNIKFRWLTETNWAVHSANPTGKINIESFLRQVIENNKQ